MPANATAYTNRGYHPLQSSKLANHFIHISIGDLKQGLPTASNGLQF
jgi:hypothetical protein